MALNNKNVSIKSGNQSAPLVATLVVLISGIILMSIGVAILNGSHFLLVVPIMVFS